MKYLLLLALFCTAIPAWSASTATCPSVEDGIWKVYETGSAVSGTYTSLIRTPPLSLSQEYFWESTTRTCHVEILEDNWWRMESLDADLWRKGQYKIEWECVRWASEWTGSPCIRELGYREDGMVIWRRP